MTAADIKALGSIWGAQNGLLSIAELDLLMRACRESGADDFLEIGHYYGLSTCAIVHALRDRGGEWRLLTIDAHLADPWVEVPAPIDKFCANRAHFFRESCVMPVFDRSETITDVKADVVFYDGDHGPEQLRFTRALLASEEPTTFLFDDRDFDYPKLCCDELLTAGWTDRSPPLRRQPGDKTNPDTMTLAWFERQKC